MIEVTDTKENKIRINPDNLVACKPQPSGETDIFFDKNIPLPRNPNNLVRKFRISEGAGDLDVKLDKYETVEDGEYWFLNPDKILSETPTGEGVRIFLSQDVSTGSTPFSTNKLHLNEVS